MKELLSSPIIFASEGWCELEIWVSLYLMIWLAFLEFISVLTNNFGWVFSVEIYILLGAIILVLAYSNLVKVNKTDAPSRIKRILKATAGFAVAQAVLGVPLFLNGRMFSIPFTGIIDFLHLAIVLAIIAQASSVATGYDMWEEKEFTQALKVT